jgi:hypothetical protein
LLVVDVSGEARFTVLERNCDQPRCFASLKDRGPDSATRMKLNTESRGISEATPDGPFPQICGIVLLEQNSGL